MYSPVNLWHSLDFYSFEVFVCVWAMNGEGCFIWKDELRICLFGIMISKSHLYLRRLMRGRCSVLGTGGGKKQAEDKGS